MVLYSIARGNDLRIACIAMCTNDVSLMHTEQPIEITPCKQHEFRL